MPDAFAALARLQRAGKIRHIGVSNFGRAKLDQALYNGGGIAVNQLPYSLLARAIEFDILPHCKNQGSRGSWVHVAPARNIGGYLSHSG